MSNKRILYNLNLSPPARAVQVVAKLLGLELELRNLDLFGREHMKDSFTKLLGLELELRNLDLFGREHMKDSFTMNPEHTVPTLDDNGFIIWDSHAICAYLVDKYAKDDKLYPKDLQLRAKCNQRLFFDAASLFVRLRDIGIQIYFNGCTEIPKEKIEAVVSALEILESFLAVDPFLVGANLTIADICLGLTVPFLSTYVPLDKYPKIQAWLKRINQTIPFFEEMNSKYTQQYKQMIQDTIEKNKQNK